MDRPLSSSKEPTRWSVVVVPNRARGEIHEYDLAAVQLRRLQWTAGALLLAVAGLAIALGFTLPRVVAYGSLLDENLALRGRLQEIDHEMGEVDRLLLRLRLYDAQLRGLEPGTGGPEGPPPADGEGGESESADADPAVVRFAQNPGILSEPYNPASASRAPATDVPMEGDGGDGGMVGPDEWARSVERRIDWFLAYFKNREPDLQQVMGDLEHRRALRVARPGLWPANGVLTSTFGWRRDPFTRRWRFHSGLDVAGELGQAVSAAAEGIVVRAEWNSGFGRVVEIDHGFGISTLYGHNSKLLVAPGDHVVAGQQIAKMGSTGRSTGVHCHFEVHLDGEPVDPLPYLTEGR